ncbi:serine hydrolase [Streptomyces goshikiensis]|uniref:serine hydrolase n=1 Tax=Streptomyces goshikiensis TaxID=1942 RepID=UPI002E15419A|nr:serine hydrolase [Streptomyces goshikiensis]WSR96978.1 class A beta-lactamase-related serine hydrolase [Streptomyces goshikiensis]
MARHRHSSPSRIPRYLAIGTVAALTAAIGFAHAESGPQAGGNPVRTAAGVTELPSSSATASSQADAQADRQAELAADVETAVRESAAGAGGNAAVAVLDLSTGARASAGTTDADDHEFDTASIVKVAILAALLLQVADDGRALTAQERWQATVMIENSDNTAADALWNAIGGAKGLAKANTRLGLTETVPGDGPYWGLTQTTPDDQLRLLQAVFGEDSALPADARSYLQGLMGSIAADQDWGVSAAADDPESARLKNGWLARSGTGLWVTNSIGRVEVAGHTLLLAVLCDGQPSQETGTALVEGLAVAATRPFADGSGTGE